MLDNLIVDFAKDTENAEKNYKVGLEYEKLGQTAAAISFFLRAAERTDDKLLTYECFIRMGKCFDKQKNRNYTVKSMYNAAITIMPERPEAYYFLSKFLEFERHYFESYTMVEIGLSTLKNKTFSDLNVGYPGEWGFIFQKAVSGWWRGKGVECRQLFKKLLNEYYDKMDVTHKLSVENNLRRLGAAPFPATFRTYKKGEYNKLRHKFKGYERIEKTYSQIYQELFVLMMLDGKENGTFIEIGGADPYHGNNTYILEKDFNWTGISIEYDEKFIANYRKERPKVKLYQEDAINFDYSKALKENFSSNVIDYLQVDIEPGTYECLINIPFDEFKFRVITYEHDHYVDGTKTLRDKSRHYLQSKGYVLLVNDLCADGESSFEDWWVHPDLVDKTILDKMKSIKQPLNNIDEYMKETGELKMFNINTNFAKRAFVVDNFYENPDAVREFAKQQKYIDGGLGRGFIGKRTEQQYLFPGLKESFESIMGKKITKWQEHGMNGRFQLNIGGEPIVYHCDDQDYAAMIYLTPDAPPGTGTSTFVHKKSKVFHKTDPRIMEVFGGIKTTLDRNPYENVDKFGNMYNRLVIFDAGCIHGASDYFGFDFEDGRLWHMFFFDAV